MPPWGVVIVTMAPCIKEVCRFFLHRVKRFSRADRLPVFVVYPSGEIIKVDSRRMTP